MQINVKINLYFQPNQLKTTQDKEGSGIAINRKIQKINAAKYNSLCSATSVLASFSFYAHTTRISTSELQKAFNIFMPN